MERFELSIVRVLKPLRMPIPPHRYLGWLMGFEPILSVPQTDVLTTNTINTICCIIYYPFTPKCKVFVSYIIHFCTPWKIRTFICGFGDRYATIAPKRCLLVMRDSNLPPSRYQRDALTKWANYQCERIVGIEPTSPTWKEGVMTIIRYSQLVDEQHLLLLWLPTKAHNFISNISMNQ